ncbi:MAG: hypothetical protein H6536_02720 [Bacteroidales bacterium]|nr:hypothetical protein [Bacteroidales bacterium]
MTRDLHNITEKFRQIDQKILELLQCASDDFMGLNTNFKELFRSSSLLSKNASSIFDMLSDSDTRSMVEELELLYKELHKSHNPIVSQSVEGIDLTKEMHEIAGNLHLQVKNLNQNLLTLKFLLANLKITGTGTPEQNSPAISQLTANYNKHINQQKLREYQNDKSLERLHELIDESIIRVDTYYLQLSQQVSLVLDLLHTSIMLFADKQQEVSLRMPNLKSITERISESIANIITNLQYHDIIRQKIEHVQTSHRALLQNLSDFDPLNEGQHIDYLSRIRDLANIQAALLVRANKEYQRAIESITDKFRSINDDMSSISQLCKELSQSQFNQELIHYTDLSHKLDSIIAPLQSIPLVEHSLMGELKVVVDSTSSTLATVGSTEKNVGEEEVFIPDNNLVALKNAYPQGNIVDQLKEVGQDVENTSNQIQTIAQRFADINRRLSTVYTDLTQKQSLITDQGEMGDRISAILDMFKKQDEQMFKLLTENFTVSKSMDSVVAGSIRQIKYYDFFEVRIIEIIKMLNEAFQEIKGSADRAEDADDMEFLKQLYTMESEHQIHESVIVGGLKPEEQDIDGLTETDNDDVELF